jgi:hypothetical protein
LPRLIQLVCGVLLSVSGTDQTGEIPTLAVRDCRHSYDAFNGHQQDHDNQDRA